MGQKKEKMRKKKCRQQIYKVNLNMLGLTYFDLSLILDKEKQDV
jgi:hypothetical protein